MTRSGHFAYLLSHWCVCGAERGSSQPRGASGEAGGERPLLAERGGQGRGRWLLLTRRAPARRSSAMCHGGMRPAQSLNQKLTHPLARAQGPDEA